MKIKKLWESYRFPNCDNCDKKCGKYKYNDLCSNLNYLKNYGEEYFERMKESFEELKKIAGKKMIVFSLGCECSLDYIAGKELFDEFSYFNIDECEWAIKDTQIYKQLENEMPQKNLNLKEGLQFLKLSQKNVSLCFFNSLNDIMNNVDNLKELVLDSLKHKQNFYIVCNYTRGGNHVLAWNEECFLKDLCKELRKVYTIKRFEILGGEGIIIKGESK